MSEWNTYRSRPGRPKHARIWWEPAEYRLSRGVQQFNGPHVRVTDANGDYGVDLNVFFETHRPVPDLEDHYIKDARVRAYRTIESSTLITRVNGTVEMVSAVQAGDFVVQNPDGEEYPMSAEEFASRYVLDE